MNKLLINHFKQLFALILSLTLVLTSIHPLCARGFLAVPGSNELVPSMVGRELLIREKKSSLARIARQERGLSSVSVVDMGSSKQFFLSLVPQGKTFKEQSLDIISKVDVLLQQQGLDRKAVVKQDIFLKDVSYRGDCERIFKTYYGEKMPATTIVHQPLIHGEFIAVEIIAVEGDNVHINRIDEHITIVETDGIKWAYVAGVKPDEDIEDTYEQALNTWEKMNRILEENGFNFKQVVRMWIYERDIFRNDEDGIQRYSKLNKAREIFFKRIGLVHDEAMRGVRFPASTGIGMSSSSLLMECIAVAAERDILKSTPIENPEQKSAYTYTDRVLSKADGKEEKPPPYFSRGMAIEIKNKKKKKKIFVSGTASIEGEDTKHAAIDRQTDRTIKNISNVLNEEGATLDDVVLVRVYIKDMEDYENVYEIVQKQFPHVPCLYLQADICRENLLVEIEAIAFCNGKPAPLTENRLCKSDIEVNTSKEDSAFNSTPEYSTGDIGSTRDRRSLDRNNFSENITEDTIDLIKKLFRGLHPKWRLFENYLDTKKGKSGRVGEGYHRYEHGIEIAYLAYLIGKKRNFSEFELLETVIAAALHDYDIRERNKPSEVQRTLQQIKEDDKLLRILRILGVDIRALLLLIERTEHSWNREKEKDFYRKIDAFNNSAQRESIRKRAELLQFLDKAEVYLCCSPQETYQRISGLHQEKKWDTSPKAVVLSIVSFIDTALKTDPQFESIISDLSDWAGKNWKRNLRYFSSLKDFLFGKPTNKNISQRNRTNDKNVNKSH